MGTKVQIENYLPGHCSMRDFSHESNGASWPSCYGDNNLSNGQLYYGFLPRNVAGSHSGYDRDVVKQTMLEHEAIFKNQVYELHRLYRVQRDLMDEARRKEQFKRPIPYEASSSSSHVPSQIQSEHVQRWNHSSLPLANSVCYRPPISGPDTIQSSPNSIRGKSIQAEPSPLQNCYSPKNSEVSESRPTKFRRRMLDLQLPADEYFDTDEVEQCGDTKVFDNISPSPDKNGKLFLNYPGKSECHGDASRSGSRVNKSKALADLNEPLQMEETTVVSSIDFLGRAGTRADVQYRDLSTKFCSSSMEVPQSSRNGSMSLPFESRSNGQDWFGYALESEQQKGSHRSINQGILPEACQLPAFLTGDHIKGDQWKAKSGGNLENSDRSYFHPSYNIPEQILASHVPNQPSFFHPANLGNSWGQPNSQTSPYLTSTSTKSLQSSPQSNVFGNKWNLNASPGLNAAFRSEPPVRNGLYQGPSSSSKELPTRSPLVGFDYVNSNYSDKPVPCKPVKDMNLNVALPNGVEIANEDHKSEDPLAALPWLRGKNSCRSEAKNPESSACPSSRKILGVPIFDTSPTPKKEDSALLGPSAIHHQSQNEEIGSSGRKVVFDMNVPCEPEEVMVVEKKMKTESGSLRNHFDLNSCITEEEIPSGVKRFTGIDLEVPIIDESEEIIIPNEDSFVKEPEKKPELPLDNVNDREEDELAKTAAEVIISISSSVNLDQSEKEAICLPLEAATEDPLLWFVDVACSRGVDLDEKEDLLPEGLDDFETMTLRLKECSPEEYFPKPSFPEIPNVDKNGTCVLATRTRKGQARRGRQRRDFQRDILPGLTSLSRHEVTEDLQTFGGLMRATGYPWHSGPNRRNATRNGCTRGRRRSTVTPPAPATTVCAPVKQPEVHSNSVEMGLEDRSLTGWGKTTRRPRRQRYPAGNPALPVPLT